MNPCIPIWVLFPIIPRKALYLSGSWQETDGTLKGAIKRVKEETVYRGEQWVEGSQCDEEPWGWQQQNGQKGRSCYQECTGSEAMNVAGRCCSQQGPSRRGAEGYFLTSPPVPPSDLWLLPLITEPNWKPEVKGYPAMVVCKLFSRHRPQGRMKSRSQGGRGCRTSSPGI